MTNTSSWITRQHECNVRFIFEKLAAQMELDTNLANDRNRADPNSIHISYSYYPGKQSFDIHRINSQSVEGVTFDDTVQVYCKQAAVEVRRKGEPFFAVLPKFDGSKCRMQVNGEIRTAEDISQAALMDLFSPGATRK